MQRLQLKRCLLPRRTQQTRVLSRARKPTPLSGAEAGAKRLSEYKVKKISLRCVICRRWAGGSAGHDA